MQNQSIVGGDKRSMARYIREKLMYMWSEGTHRKCNVKTAVKEISHALREEKLRTTTCRFTHAPALRIVPSTVVTLPLAASVCFFHPPLSSALLLHSS